MLTLDTQKSLNVAEKTRQLITSYDDAIGSTASLTLSLLDATRDTNITVQESQKLIQSLHECAGNVLSGRAGMVSTITLLSSIRRRSNQVDTDFGCPGDEPFGQARSRTLSVVAA